MKNTPEISVIVPVYNVKKYLVRCLDSVLNSTFKNTEIILVDDGSTDGSSDICKEYAKKDKRIVIIRQENRGLSAARNKGLEKAKGKYISFIDSDDYIDTTMLEKLHEAMEREKVDLVGCNAWEKENDGRQRALIYFHIKKDTKTSIAELNKKIYASPFHVWRFLFNREMIKNLSFPLVAFEDAPFMLEVYSKVQSLYFLAEPLYYYCQNEGTLSRKVSEKNMTVLQIKDVVVKALTDSKNNNFLEPHFWGWYARNCAGWYRRIPKSLQAQFLHEVDNMLPYNDYQLFLSRIKKEKKIFYLFDFIPLLTVEYKHGKKYYKLMGKLPLGKIRYHYE